MTGLSWEDILPLPLVLVKPDHIAIFCTKFNHTRQKQIVPHEPSWDTDCRPRGVNKRHHVSNGTQAKRTMQNMVTIYQDKFSNYIMDLPFSCVSLKLLGFIVVAENIWIWKVIL